VNDKLIEYLIIKPLDEALVQVIYFSFPSRQVISYFLLATPGCRRLLKENTIKGMLFAQN